MMMLGSILYLTQLRLIKKPFIWRQHLNETEVLEIQENCKTVLFLWGLNLYQEGEHITTFEPVVQMGKFEL